jgi:hypothetical protein
MKTLMIILFGVLTLHTDLKAQDIAADKVPSVVLNAFQAKFPNAKDIDWEMKGDLYKVEFEIGSRGHDLWLDKSGVIKKHKEDFPKSELPQVIRQKIEADFKGYKIDDVDKVEENGAVFYLVDLDGTAGDRKVLFTSAGEIKENTPD